jgi:hypothetical protein
MASHVPLISTSASRCLPHPPYSPLDYWLGTKCTQAWSFLQHFSVVHNNNLTNFSIYHYAGSILFFSVLLLLLRWHYSPMRTFASLMALSQSALFFDLSFQLLILHFLMSVCTQFHHLFLGHPLGQLPWGFLLNTWLTVLLFSILLTWPIHLSRLILTNDSISKSPNTCFPLI